MSKMRVPKMDVVRFKENDVIVASGAIPSLTLSGFANITKNDGKMTYKGKKYNDSNYNDLITALTEDGYSDWIGGKYKGDSGFIITHPVSWLFINDSKGEINTNAPNGTYIWNSDIGAFLKQ